MQRKYEKMTGKYFDGRRFGLWLSTLQWRWRAQTVAGSPRREKEIFCVCDCGTERWVRGSSLRSRTSRSCGCHYEVPPGRKPYAETWERRCAYSLLNSAGARSRQKGLEKTIGLRWLLPRLEAGYCEVTGLAFERPDGVRGPFSPSLDRHDPLRGYTPENCRVVVYMYNAAKNSFTDADVMRMAEALTSKRQQL